MEEDMSEEIVFTVNVIQEAVLDKINQNIRLYHSRCENNSAETISSKTSSAKIINDKNIFIIISGVISQNVSTEIFRHKLFQHPISAHLFHSKPFTHCFSTGT
jgi:hypothetical protein